MTTQDESLKPCPFCGGDAEIFGNHAGGTVARCKVCKISTKGDFSLGDYAEDKVAAAWNTRAAVQGGELAEKLNAWIDEPKE